MIILILILTLNFSCAEKRSTEGERNMSEVKAISKTDTLKFTSAIRAIFQDRKGNYWFGSHNEGVCFYNGKSFVYYTTDDGLSDNQIRSIQEDKNGNIWIGTANGISLYVEGNFTNYPPKNNNPIDWNVANGDLWFYAWEEDGINRFDGINMNYLIFPKPKEYKYGSSLGVTGITKDNQGKVWIATYAALFSFDGKKLNTFDNESFNLNTDETLHIRSVLADSKGRIWIGNNGIGVLLMEDNSIINFSEENNLIHPTSTRSGDNKSQPSTLEHTFAIEEDSQGNIWFGDVYTGAWKYDGKTLKNYLVNDNPSKPMIWTIYKDNKDNLLFGMADGNIFKFNGKAFEKQF